MVWALGDMIGSANRLDGGPELRIACRERAASVVRKAPRLWWIDEMGSGQSMLRGVAETILAVGGALNVYNAEAASGSRRAREGGSSYGLGLLRLVQSTHVSDLTARATVMKGVTSSLACALYLASLRS